MKCALNILLLFTLFQSSAQNLVPNPSFEDTVSCPVGANNVDLAIGWFGCGSSDFFHTCAYSFDTGVPYNMAGYQNPSDGQGYTGFLSYLSSPFFPDDTMYREYVVCNLPNPLTVGAKYHISFKVAAGYDTLMNPVNCASNNIGALFTTGFYDCDTFWIENYLLNYTPMINHNVIISDTLNWTLIEGCFVADSAYSYLTIGNFNYNSQTDTIKHFESFSGYDMAYYYLDEVTVTEDTILCGGNIGISELSKPVKKLIRIVDTMGRETEDKPNTLLIYVYSDGTTEKVYRVK